MDVPPALPAPPASTSDEKPDPWVDRYKPVTGAQAVDELARTMVDQVSAGLVSPEIFGGIGLAGVVTFIIGVAGESGLAVLGAVVGLVGLALYVREALRPDDHGYRGASLVMMPVAHASGHAGIDLSNTAEPASVRGGPPKDPRSIGRLLQTRAALLRQAPPVLKRHPVRRVALGDGGEVELHEYEANLWRVTHDLAESLADREFVEASFAPVSWLSIPFPVVEDDDVPGTWPVCRSLDIEDVRDGLVAVAHGDADVDESLFGDVARLLREQPALSEELRSVRRESLDDLVPAFHTSLASAADLASFNFYCPRCNDGWRQKTWQSVQDMEEAVLTTAPARPDPATRLIYVLSEDHWKCPACGSVIQAPLSVHRVLDELLFPAYEFLLQENRVARLKVYSEARQRKLDYRNQWSQESELAFQGNRQTREAVESRIRDLIARIATARAAIASFGRLIDDVRSLQESRLRDVHRRYETLSDELAEGNREFLARHDAFVSSIRGELRDRIEEHARVAHVEHEKELELLQRMAASAERSEALQKQQTKSTEEIAAVEKARAHAQGLDRGRGPLGVGKNIRLGVEGAMAAAAGKSLVDERRDKEP